LRALCLQVWDDDDFELQAFGLVNGHQLHAVVGGCVGIGQSGEFVQRGMERWAEQVLLAGREAVEASPQQVQVGTGCGVATIGSSKAEPDLLEPGSERGGGQARLQSGLVRQDS
jgi:hypothetical protein